MKEAATARKLPEGEHFVDLSDYARPAAAWIARRLKDTPLRAPQVTAVWCVIGLAAAGCYAAGGYRLALLGAAAIQAKNVLDAVDGSLARLQGRPSRIGRFLDSIGDAVVAAALAAGLAVAVARTRPLAYAAGLAGAALLAGLLQASLFNYYYVRYRGRRGGDRTSRVRERITGQDEIHYRGRPFAMRLLRGLIRSYGWIYGWQDEWVRRLDGWAAAPLRRSGRGEEAEALRDDRHLLTAVSALGPGVQILILDLYTLAGRRQLGLALELYLWTIALGGTLYAAAIVWRLRRPARNGLSSRL